MVRRALSNQTRLSREYVAMRHSKANNNELALCFGALYVEP